MGSFNRLIAEPIQCVYCGKKTQFILQFKFGTCWQRDYRIGESVRWDSKRRADNHPGMTSVVALGTPEWCDHGQHNPAESGDWDIYIERDQIIRIESSTHMPEFLRSARPYLVIGPDAHQNDDD